MKEKIINILMKTLDEIKYTIPQEVLKVAFRDDIYNWRQAPVSMDQQILTKVIKPRVFVDANLVGGKMAIISLEGLPVKHIDTFSVVFEIPTERTSGREIISVLSIGYLPQAVSFNSMGNGGTGTVNPRSMSDLMSASQRLMDSHSNIPVISNATCDLIGFNTVLIRDQMRVTAAYQLRCMMANETNLNNINPRSYLAFTKLCTLAVKSYIYNKMLIAIDQAFLQGGQELGSFRNYVESLADSEEMYKTYLTEVWAKTAFMGDVPSYNRFIKIQLSPGI